MLHRHDLLRDLSRIRERCNSPAVSVGIVHEGKCLYDEHVGFKRLDEIPSGYCPPNSDTLYTIGSLSKTFVTVEFCALVEEGKLSWTDSVKDHFADFCPKDDPEVAKPAFVEILRHSAGIDNPTVTCLSPKAPISKDRFIELLNEVPTHRDGKSPRGKYVYSNIAYGLIVLVIEKKSGMSFSCFLQKRILTPLGMHSTAVTFAQLAEHEQHGRVAHSYAKMSDGRWERLEHYWTDESNGPILGMLGIRSSVKDMFIYFSAIMEAYATTASEQSKARLGADKWSQAPFELLNRSEESPLKGVQYMLDGAYWELSCDCDPKAEHTYRHLVPVVKAFMPCKAISCTSDNCFARSFPGDGKVLGLGLEEQRMAFVFNGVTSCGTTSMKIFPETRNAGDAAEFANLLLTQDLFDLQPRKDIIAWADNEVASVRQLFGRVKRQVDYHRTATRPTAGLRDYVGVYSGFGIDFVVEASEDGEDLELLFNDNRSLGFPLDPHGKDCFSFWPRDRDEWLTRGWLDFCHWEIALIRFRRSGNLDGKVDEATWVWDAGADAAVFTRSIN